MCFEVAAATNMEAWSGAGAQEASGECNPRPQAELSASPGLRKSLAGVQDVC